jgi:arylsulfatase A-like enzyme
MKRLRRLFLLLAIAGIASAGPAAARTPNVIFILADDLAQGDLGSYGQKRIKTPHLDRMAAEGTRYTQAYAGTSVCAPSRTSLMIGLHTGHSTSRGNRKPPDTVEGQWPIPANVPTVAELFKQAGYATACTGKWGMGYFNTTGSPLRKGFDRFFGYNCQSKAHHYFPPYLDDNDRRLDLDGKTYAQDLIQKETLSWVRAQKDNPFFLFYAVTLPHGRFEIDDLGEYRDLEGWTEQAKTYAAMVTRLDRDVGQLLTLLAELGIDDNTLVIFAGDNGSALAEDSERGRFFDQSMGGKLRGIKRSMYEGGLRQAALARWPGVVPAGRVSDEPWAFWDFLPTAAELIGVTLPPNQKTDGLSLVNFLKGGPAPQRDYFYWELHEQSFKQAIRFGDWKAVRNGAAGAIELYDLAKDKSERENLASRHPDVVANADALMKSARTDDPNWPVR